MKNKKLIYLLIVFVAGVWGFIFYKVFVVTAADGGNSYIINKPAPLRNELPEDAAITDTFTPALNYRDPFSAIPVKSTAEMPGKAPLTPAVVPAVNLDFVKYTGYIINPATRKVVSILIINGKEQMMTEGTVSEQIRLIKNYKDSVRILYKGRPYFIHKVK